MTKNKQLILKLQEEHDIQNNIHHLSDERIDDFDLLYGCIYDLSNMYSDYGIV